MDLFELYIDSLSDPKADQKSKLNTIMSQLTTLRCMLNYKNDKSRYYKTLRNVIRCFCQLNMYGEAYKALSILPPEEVGDLGHVPATIENQAIQNSNMTIEIITKCNLRCPLCVAGGEKQNYDLRNQHMSLDNFKQIWNKVRKFTSLAILVGMGESFLHPSIYEILEYIDKPILIDTNGNMPMDHDRVVKSNISRLVFSIDGIDQQTYEKYRVGGKFNQAIKNLEQTVAAKRRLGRGPEIVFKYIVFKHNEMYLKQASELARQIGVDRFQINECNIGRGVGREEVRQFIPCGRDAISRIDCIDFENDTIYPKAEMETPHCTYTFSSPFVAIDGSLRPCCAVPNGLVEGNLFKEDFLTIWNSEPYKKFRIQALLNKYEISDCRTCLMPCNTFGHLFAGTELEYPKRGTPSDDSLYVKDLIIDEDYAQKLKEQGLLNELKYFADSGKYKGEIHTN